MKINLEKLMNEGVLFDGRYKLLRPLSSAGGTADVWLALDSNTIDEVYSEESDEIVRKEDTGIKVAIKIYRPKNAMDIGEQRFRDEFKIVFNCHHSNLVQPINFSVYEGLPYLVLPYCRKGSSEQLVGRDWNPMDLWRYISDVAAGLDYLHSFDPTIVHHDIKPANVLIDDSGNYAITDFGISSHRGNSNEGYDDSQSGTLAYMAPERFVDDYESIPESDIWALGATLYELVAGRVPFGEEGGQSQTEPMISPNGIVADIPNDIKALICECLALDPKKRPSAASIYTRAQAHLNPGIKLWQKIAAGVICLLAVLGLVLGLAGVFGRKDKVLSDEEIYQKALALMNSDDSNLLARGLATMDSLGMAKGYVPAIYEVAHTYGWYSDSTSLHRKALLGIEIYPETSTDRYLPVSNQINNKAIGLFTRIVELNDSSYASINANALYRLACYYASTQKVVGNNPKSAREFLLRAEQWAEKCKDTELQTMINYGLEEINRKNKK